MRYELKNFRGDIRQVISDIKYREEVNGVVEYTPDVWQVEDSYPFGWNIKDRSFTHPNPEEAYRFGFNGKENDPDFGNQLIQDYGFRLYNPAIAKFLSVDPLAPEYPWYTPYQFAGNKPIWAIDLDGLEEATTQELQKNNSAMFNVNPMLPIIAASREEGGQNGQVKHFWRQVYRSKYKFSNNWNNLVGASGEAIVLASLSNKFRVSYADHSLKVLKYAKGNPHQRSGSIYKHDIELAITPITFLETIDFTPHDKKKSINFKLNNADGSSHILKHNVAGYGIFDVLKIRAEVKTLSPKEEGAAPYNAYRKIMEGYDDAITTAQNNPSDISLLAVDKKVYLNAYNWAYRSKDPSKLEQLYDKYRVLRAYGGGRLLIDNLHQNANNDVKDTMKQIRLNTTGEVKTKND